MALLRYLGVGISGLLLSCLSWADLSNYHLNEFRSQIYLEFDGQKYYLASYGENYGAPGSTLLIKTALKYNPDIHFSVYETHVQDYKTEKVISEVTLIYEGVCLGEISPKQNGFVVEYFDICAHTGNYGHKRDTWHWEKGQFSRVSSVAIPTHLENYARLLKEKKFNEAMLLLSGEIQGDVDSLGCLDEYYNDLVMAVYPDILSHYQSDQYFVATSLALRLFELTPVSSYLCESQRSETKQYKLNASLYLEATTQHTIVVNDLAFIIGSTQPDLAIGLLRQVIEHQPNRSEAYLNLADLIYKQTYYSEQPHQTKSLYQTYIQLMKAEGRETAIPEYATKRAAAIDRRNSINRRASIKGKMLAKHFNPHLAKELPQWDTLCIILPLTPNKQAQEIVGTSFDFQKLSRVSFDSSVTLFLLINNGEVVHYLNGRRLPFDFSAVGQQCYAHESIAFDIVKNDYYRQVKPAGFLELKENN